jgi:hypothetical protein
VNESHQIDKTRARETTQAPLPPQASANDTRKITTRSGRCHAIERTTPQAGGGDERIAQNRERHAGGHVALQKAELPGRE